MKTFKEREKAYEAKFAQENDLLFRTLAKRNKILGIWAAEKLGLSPLDTEKYVKSVVIADLQETGDGDVVKKLLEDLGSKTNEKEILSQIDQAMSQAKAELTE